MPALTIAAVDFTTDQLNIVAHGLNTGDGFLAAYTVAGVLPAPLAPVTDYWAIRVDADHIKLATSSANALANTPINLTTNGSGTLLLLQGLPYRVPRIPTAGSQIKSVDDSSTWASLVALWNFLTGQAQSVFAGIVLAANQHVQVSGTGAYKRGTRVRHISASAGTLITVPAAPYAYHGGGTLRFKAVGDQFEIPITVDEGEQIQSVTAFVGCGGTDVMTMKVFKTTNTVGAAETSDNVQLGATQTTAGHANLIEALIVSGLTETVPATLGTNYVAQFALTAYLNNPIVFGLDVVTTVP